MQRSSGGNQLQTEGFSKDREGSLTMETHMLPVFPSVVPPLIRGGYPLRPKLGGKDNAASTQSNFFDFAFGVREVLQTFKAGYAIVLLADTIFKSTCKKVLCLGVIPVKIKPYIPHPSHVDSMSSSVIQPLPFLAGQQIDRQGRLCPGSLGSCQATRVQDIDDPVIGFFQPKGSDREQVIAARTMVNIGLVCP